MWQEIGEAIKLWWAVIGAILGVGGLIIKWVVVPLRKIGKKIDNNSDAVATLQHDRLNQAYRYYTQKRWIPHYEKVALLEMFDQYTGSGHNHLYQHYREDIEKLSEEEPV